MLKGSKAKNYYEVGSAMDMNGWDMTNDKDEEFIEWLCTSMHSIIIYGGVDNETSQ